MSELYSELDAEFGGDSFADFELPAEPFDEALGFGYADDEVGAAAREYIAAQVGEAVGEFEASFGPPPLTREAWEQTRSQLEETRALLETLPAYGAYRAEQQALARGEGAIANALAALPEPVRPRALELAQGLVAVAEPRLGGDADLARAALAVGAEQALKEAEGIDAFARAVHTAAAELQVDPATIDVAAVFRAANKAMPKMAAHLPGVDAETVAVRSIIGAVRAQTGRAIERPLSEDYGLAGEIVRDLRGQPEEVPTADYRNKPWLRPFDVAAGRPASDYPRHMSGGGSHLSRRWHPPLTDGREQRKEGRT